MNVIGLVSTALFVALILFGTMAHEQAAHDCRAKGGELLRGQCLRVEVIP